jgi:hypothetical protein
MGKLTSGSTYRPELAGAVREYQTQNAIDLQFIGLRVLPEAPLPLAEGSYPILKKENFRKVVETNRSPGAAFNRGDWTWDKQNYVCLENAHEIPLDIKEAEKYADVIDYEEESAIGADFVVRLAHERRVAAAVMNATTWTATNVAVDWDTIATSTPLVDLDVAANKLEDKLGVPRNQLSLILPRSKWQALRNATSVLNALKEWNSGITNRMGIQQQVLAQYLDVKEILVGASSYDSANEGIAQSLSQIWPAQYGMLALLAPGPQAPRQTLCLGRTIRWTSGMPDFVTIETYDSKDTDSEIVRARHFTDELIIADFAAELLDLDRGT